MSDMLKNDILAGMNLPRLDHPLGAQSRTDNEQVGFGERTAGDELKTAVNNAIAVAESLGKAAASPFLGIAVGVQAAATGDGVAVGPGAPDEDMGVGQRAAYLVGAPVVGLVGTLAYGVQAAADLGQAGLALARAGIKLLTG